MPTKDYDWVFPSERNKGTGSAYTTLGGNLQVKEPYYSRYCPFEDLNEVEKEYILDHYHVLYASIGGILSECHHALESRRTNDKS